MENSKILSNSIEELKNNRIKEYKNFLLSEIKISDVRESDLKYYEIAVNFYELFIKHNL